MGFFTDNCMTMTLTNRKHRKFIPHKLFLKLNPKRNALLFGGAPGTLAEKKSLSFIEKQLNFAIRKKLPAVLLCANRQQEIHFSERFRKKIFCFGENFSYDPFHYCSSFEQASFIMKNIVYAYTAQINLSADADKLLDGCQLLLECLRSCINQFPSSSPDPDKPVTYTLISYPNFAVLAQGIIHCDSVQQYADWLESADEIKMPDYLRKKLNDYWIPEQIQQFREFWFHMSSAFTPLNSVAPQDSNNDQLSVQEILLNNQSILLNAGNHPLVLSALYAELCFLCKQNFPLFLFNANIPINPEIAEILFGSEAISFGMYFSSPEKMQFPLEMLHKKLDTLVSVGVQDYAEAQKLVQLFGTLSRQADKLYPELLMQGVQGLPDGSACVMNRKGAVCCAWLA